ncbi:MAG: helix-turn-helix domain-containing protein, partial [Desulfobacterales bacterium]
MITIDDASKLLTMPKATIKRWVKQGKIPVEELNGEYFFTQKGLEKWARKHHIFLHGSVPKTSSQNIHP